MCGILLVKSINHIPIQNHLKALDHLRRRGPDGQYWSYRNGIFIGQTLLHITGTDEFYHQQRNQFTAFNGEIYNYQQFGSFSSDTELVAETLRNRMFNMDQWQGPWAWAWTDFDNIAYASDPQGERCLYRYQDEEILIVSSEITPITYYRDLKPQPQIYHSKHWPTIQSTPWQNVERISPGWYHDHTGPSFQIDDIFRWRTTHAPVALEEAVEEFSLLWSQVISTMRSKWPNGLAFSGGVDSAVILAALPDFQHLYTVNTIGKDKIATQVKQFLTTNQQQALIEIPVDQERWAANFIDVIKYTQLPAQSWSWPGQWAVAQKCQERVLFTGVGADELFGGYDVYERLDYTQNRSVSPYSLYADDDEHMIQLWYQCLEFYSGDPKPATLMMDYLIQITAVDMRGVDLCTQAWGVEPRSPFLHPRIIRFALNLPWSLRQGKPVLKEYFKKFWPESLIYAKEGFAGHCNDSYDWLDINIARELNRHQDWRNILLATYRRHVQPNLFADQTIVDRTENQLAVH